MRGEPTASPTRTARRSEYAERYEVLRTHAVADHASASRDGLVVLRRLRRRGLDGCLVPVAGALETISAAGADRAPAVLALAVVG
ncbi:hypothetical protein [uncultured Thiohalocapsa sp.]|uniref:hypothetical protein n=1 Tax=uncultured Thiohalocapsa sp. TaxID=768990 RepID=UPI0025E7C2D1|nr:hypothetical protein [uncultured Thiohalocapsa sp.]